MRTVKHTRIEVQAENADELTIPTGAMGSQNVYRIYSLGVIWYCH